MGRRILGCGPHVTNEAVLGDLGWLPLLARRDVAALRMWGRVMRRDPDSLLRQSYDGLHSLMLLSRRRRARPAAYAWSVPNWVSRVHRLMVRKYPTLAQFWRQQAVPHDPLLSASSNRDSWRDIVLKAVRTSAGASWRSRVDAKPKLVTYASLIGPAPLLQPYLRESAAGDVVTRLISGLRCGTNDLAVEQGRWEGVPRAARTCTLCSLAVTEDETHFLVSCPFYAVERDDLAAQLAASYGVVWESLSSSEQLRIALLGTGMPGPMARDYFCNRGGSAVLRYVRQFVFHAHTRRSSSLPRLLVA